jgi:hypothetical protein
MQVITAEAAIRRAHPFSSLASNICASQQRDEIYLIVSPLCAAFDSPHLISFVVLLVCSANHV